uniref:Uncharacterized protein n=1 Tax=Neovison vison TaxID=452646 RepID=A0A8C7AL50_NEOVI
MSLGAFSKGRYTQLLPPPASPGPWPEAQRILCSKQTCACCNKMVSFLIRPLASGSCAGRILSSPLSFVPGSLCLVPSSGRPSLVPLLPLLVQLCLPSEKPLRREALTNELMNEDSGRAYDGIPHTVTEETFQPSFLLEINSPT